MEAIDLTTETGMLDFLNEHFQACKSVVKVVSAGHSAWVFRATLEKPSPRGNSSVVIKHVQHLAARSFNMRLDPARMDYEAHALTLLSSLVEANPHGERYAVPHLERYYEAQKVLVLEDLGEVSTLKHWLTPETPTNVAEGIGRTLAAFLANLHDVSTTDRSVLQPFETNLHGREISATFMFGDFMTGQAAKYGFPDPLIADAAAAAKHEVLHDHEVLTMGDFWTGNVLIGDGNGEDERSDPGGIPQLYVVDFELTKPGPASYDVGQMAAEMYFMTKFSDAPKQAAALLRAFLESYRARREVDGFKVAIRVGAHLVAVGEMTNPAARMEQVEALVGEGVAFIRAGWFKDGEFLRVSFLAPLTVT